MLAEMEKRNAAKEAAAVPRLLVIDMTAMGNGTATGEIKSTLLRRWGVGRILQVSAPKPDTFAIVRPAGLGLYREEEEALDAVHEAIDEFNPEVILYRPLADRPALHAFAMEEIAKRDVPLVTWIMDDWPARLEAKDPAGFPAMDADLRWLLERSAQRLTISAAMSRAYEVRYGCEFDVVANGVDPADWPGARIHQGEGLLLRYAGGLAPDMNAAAIQRVAQAVEQLHGEGHDIRFEINTRPHWLKLSGHRFEGLSASALSAKGLSSGDYKRWLVGADALLIAYNEDEASLRYTRYSMANKLPECLASGAALLVHGPLGVATVDVVKTRGIGVIAQEATVASVKATLLRLLDPTTRTALSAAADRAVQAHYDVGIISDRLEDMVRKAAGKPRLRTAPTPVAAAPAPVSALMPRNTPTGPAHVQSGRFLFFRAPDLSGPDTLESWCTGAEALLAAFRADRAARVVLRAEDYVAAPEAMISALKARKVMFGEKEAATLQTMVRPNADPLPFLVAPRALEGDARARGLWRELSAIALPVPKGAEAKTGPNTDPELKASTTCTDGAEPPHAMLEEQLAAKGLELARAKRETSEARAETQEAKRKVVAREAALAVAEARANAAETARATLRAQLAAKEQELTSARREMREARAEMKNAQRKAEERDAELARVQTQPA
jgi:glycosyltransferase involved in cell wall biosynthesis